MLSVQQPQKEAVFPMINETLRRAIALVLCVGALCGCASRAQFELPEEPAPLAASPDYSEGDIELLFTPLQEEPDGIAGLNPTSTVYLEGLEEAALLRGGPAESESAEGPAVSAAFNQTYPAQLSQRVKQWRNNVNSDIRGWVRVPGTNIDYAVCYHPDVNYYTHRGYYKEYSTMGVVWTNGSTKFGTPSQISNNTVLYGHNWTNCSNNPRIASPNDIMFAQLTGYHHLSVAQANPYIYYSTADADMTFKIFACFYTELAFDYIQSSGGQWIIDEAKRRSRHNFGVDVNSSDKILTLSTCTRAYGQTSNQRFVVMARLLRPGETVSPYTITSNPGHKQPYVW